MPFAPRAMLKRQMQAARHAGFEVRLATELEFYLFHNDPREARQRRISRSGTDDCHAFHLWNRRRDRATTIPVSGLPGDGSGRNLGRLGTDRSRARTVGGELRAQRPAPGGGSPPCLQSLRQRTGAAGRADGDIHGQTSCGRSRIVLPSPLLAGREWPAGFPGRAGIRVRSLPRHVMSSAACSSISLPQHISSLRSQTRISGTHRDLPRAVSPPGVRTTGRLPSGSSAKANRFESSTDSLEPTPIRISPRRH